MRWLTLPVAAAVALAGCGGEDIAENIIEDRIEAESGEDVDIDFDDGDVSFRTEDGEIRIDVDEDGDGSISISGSSDDGDISIQSEDGETIIQSDDGTTIIGSESGELPEGFPGEVPLPDGFTIDYSQATTTPDGQAFFVGGQAPGDPAAVTDDYVAARTDAGFEQAQVTTMPDGSFFAFDAGEFQIGGSISEGPDADTSDVVINVTPSG